MATSTNPLLNTPAPAPSEQVAQKTLMYTYFTKAEGSFLLLTVSSRLLVRLTLEDAGPVAVGLSKDLVPVTSGKGALLPTDQPFEFSLSKGDQLYIAAEAVNRVAVVVEPADPVLEAVLAELKNSNTRFEAMLNQLKTMNARSAR